MNNEEWNSVDPARSKLRAFAARFEQEIARLGADVGGTPHSARVSAVTTAWREFVGLLALGDEPELRTCPHCQRKILCEATRCRYCMRSSAAEERGRNASSVKEANA